MKLELHFTDRDIERIWNTACRGFLAEQKDRFEVVSTTPDGRESTMYWCGENYLHAMIVAGYMKQKHIVPVAILWDTIEHEYVAWVGKELEVIGAEYL